MIQVTLYTLRYWASSSIFTDKRRYRETNHNSRSSWNNLGMCFRSEMFTLKRSSSFSFLHSDSSISRSSFGKTCGGKDCQLSSKSPQSYRGKTPACTLAVGQATCYKHTWLPIPKSYGLCGLPYSKSSLMRTKRGSPRNENQATKEEKELRHQRLLTTKSNVKINLNRWTHSSLSNFLFVTRPVLRCSHKVWLNKKSWPHI